MGHPGLLVQDYITDIPILIRGVPIFSASDGDDDDGR
jgi:hypothetical protein